jgi:hypothetical protein
LARSVGTRDPLRFAFAWQRQSYEFREGKLIRGQVHADTAVLRDTVEGVTPA